MSSEYLAQLRESLRKNLRPGPIHPLHDPADNHMRVVRHQDMNWARATLPYEIIMTCSIPIRLDQTATPKRHFAVGGPLPILRHPGRMNFQILLRVRPNVIVSRD